jgi:transposase-like protein
MQQMCPRCHEQYVIKSGISNVGRYAGLVGVLVANSTASYQCPSCGKIPISEFPEEFQSNVKKKRMLSILGAVVILVLVVVFFGWQAM